MSKLMTFQAAGLLVEKFSPLIVSVLCLLSVMSERDTICGLIASGHLNMSNLYSAVLSWASIQVGFAFAVYGFVLGKTQGFVQELQDTRAMRLFLSYVKRANLGGFTLTFVSLPLVVAAPKPTDSSSITFFAIALWFSLFVWTLLAFTRVAFNFGYISAVKDKPPFFGA